MSRRHIARWAAALGMQGAAGAFMALGSPGPAQAGPDKCVVTEDGSTTTCSGNQSNGIRGGSDYDYSRTDTTQLIIQNLTQPIAIANEDIGAIDVELSISYPPPGVQLIYNDANNYVSNASGPGIVLLSSSRPFTQVRFLQAELNGSIYGGGSGSAIEISGTGNGGTSGGGDGDGGAPGYMGDEIELYLGEIIGQGVKPANGFIENDGGATVSLYSKGGHGGAGADGFAYSGGNGGAGGLSGAAEFQIVGAWQLRSLSANSPVIYLHGLGGDGGGGGVGTFAGGGTGGQGGQGGDLYIDGNASMIIRAGAGNNTSGASDSPGVLLISQAGNGGNGGAGDTFASGGDGGAGGGGGEIHIDSINWTIFTSLYRSHGIAAYSLGGTGGNGGNGGVFDGGSGSGGSTGPSGEIDLSIEGSISTLGAESYGIVAQSIAGHGGAGGSSGAIVAFAASGGSAGAGGTVTIQNTAKITTASDQSVLISAQSIGGGGGHGGSGFGAFYGEGGSGANGGDGGPVTVTNSGQLTSSGSDAHGIFAQSIGGAGGDGGNAGGTLVALGGGGKYASDGGQVKVVNTGVIATGAATTNPILAGSDPTCGTGCSSGIFAQSIGGGGGNGGATGGLIAAVGGAAGGGGNGGTVEIDNTARIGTTLENSHAIIAQSVGGGGGHGGGSVTASPGLAIAIGGSGASGGGAGQVTVNSTDGAALSTTGTGSHGILAQSTGGGGGRGGFAVAVSANLASASFAIGGQGGAGGSGGAVTVNTKLIKTTAAVATASTPAARTPTASWRRVMAAVAATAALRSVPPPGWNMAASPSRSVAMAASPAMAARSRSRPMRRSPRPAAARTRSAPRASAVVAAMAASRSRAS